MSCAVSGVDQGCLPVWHQRLFRAIRATAQRALSLLVCPFRVVIVDPFIAAPRASLLYAG